ncbi:unnamed protein product [Calypogeia fissa]
MKEGMMSNDTLVMTAAGAAAGEEEGLREKIHGRDAGPIFMWEFASIVRSWCGKQHDLDCM